MTIEQLLTLQTIVELGSFRAASQKMNKAQSALSYAVRTLEAEVGFKIFSRDQYRPSLTLQGQTFLKKSSQLVSQLHDLERTATYLKNGFEPEFKIALSALLPLPLIAGCLREFQVEFPKTELTIQQDVLSAEEQLLEGHANVAFGELFSVSGKLRSKKITVVEMIPCCSKNHPLSKRRGKASTQELDSYPQIILSSTLQSKNREVGIENKNQRIRVSDLSTKMQFIEAGLGWGYMPKHFVSNEIKKKSIMVTHANSIAAPIYMAFSSDRPMGPCGKFVWNYFE
ncbi:MAG: LysR family transcriptional regulator, partial [Bdellovibrionia bacterium]